MKIEEPAQRYILERGQDATVELVKSKLCCGNISLPPTVRVGRPIDPQQYEVTTVNGITLYIDKFITNHELLTLTLAGFMGYKYLAIEGWRIC